MLLASLGAALYRHQREELGISAERVEANLEHAVERVLPVPPPGR